METNLIRKKRKKQSLQDNVFYYALMAWPVLQFVVFYILTRCNAVLYSFQSYDLISDKVTWTFDYVRTAFRLMTTSGELRTAMKITLLSFVLSVGVGTPLGLLFSEYISKKMWGAGKFRVLLFLPSVISAIVMATIYQFFVERAVPELVRMMTGNSIKGLMENRATRYAAIMFYNIWVSFGINVLMYSNAMSGISTDVVEAAHIDGATSMKEFFHISLPSIYPTVTTFLITGVAAMFTNQYNMYSFYGDTSPSDLINYGYYFYQKTHLAESRAEYSQISAIGLLLTCIALPLTLLTKRLLEKFGPSED